MARLADAKKEVGLKEVQLGAEQPLFVLREV